MNDKPTTGGVRAPAAPREHEWLDRILRPPSPVDGNTGGLEPPSREGMALPAENDASWLGRVLAPPAAMRPRVPPPPRMPSAPPIGAGAALPEGMAREPAIASFLGDVERARAFNAQRGIAPELAREATALLLAEDKDYFTRMPKVLWGATVSTGGKLLKATGRVAEDVRSLQDRLVNKPWQRHVLGMSEQQIRDLEVQRGKSFRDIERAGQRMEEWVEKHPKWQPQPVEGVIDLVTSPSKLMETVATTMPFMAATTAAAAVGGPGAAFAVAFGVEGQGAYDEAVANDASDQQARVTGYVVGTINGIIEFAQAGQILKFIRGGAKPTLQKQASKAALRRLPAALKRLGGRVPDAIRLAVHEGIEEVLQGATGDIAGYTIYGKDPGAASEIFSRRVQEFIGGSVSAVALGGGSRLGVQAAKSVGMAVRGEGAATREREYAAQRQAVIEETEKKIERVRKVWPALAERVEAERDPRTQAKLADAALREIETRRAKAAYDMTSGREIVPVTEQREMAVKPPPEIEIQQAPPLRGMEPPQRIGPSREGMRVEAGPEALSVEEREEAARIREDEGRVRAGRAVEEGRRGEGRADMEREAPEEPRRAAQEVAKAKEPWEMTRAEFTKAAERGKLHKRTGKVVPGEESAKTPLRQGELNRYSGDDIARFYVSRRWSGTPQEGWSYDDAVRQAHRELVEDALREGKDVPDELLHQLAAEEEVVAKPAEARQTAAKQATKAGRDAWKLTLDQYIAKYGRKGQDPNIQRAFFAVNHRKIVRAAAEQGKVGAGIRDYPDLAEKYAEKKEPRKLGPRYEDRREKYEIVRAALARGETIIHATQYRATKLTKPEHIRLVGEKDIQIPEGRRWVSIGPDNLDYMAKQAGAEIGRPEAPQEVKPATTVAEAAPKAKKPTLLERKRAEKAAAPQGKYYLWLDNGRWSVHYDRDGDGKSESATTHASRAEAEEAGKASGLASSDRVTYVKGARVVKGERGAADVIYEDGKYVYRTNKKVGLTRKFDTVKALRDYLKGEYYHGAKEFDADIAKLPTDAQVERRAELEDKNVFALRAMLKKLGIEVWRKAKKPDLVKRLMQAEAAPAAAARETAPKTDVSMEQLGGEVEVRILGKWEHGWTMIGRQAIGDGFKVRKRGETGTYEYIVRPENIRKVVASAASKAQAAQEPTAITGDKGVDKAPGIRHISDRGKQEAPDEGDKGRSERVGAEGGEALDEVPAQAGDEAQGRGETVRGPEAGGGRRESDAGATAEEGHAPRTGGARSGAGTSYSGPEGIRGSGRRSDGAPGVNYRITDADKIAAGGVVTKIRANLDAIRTLKQIETENRRATPDEQAILVKYSGWGHSPQIFQESHKKHRAERAELLKLLTADEYNDARRSTINAHFTSPAVIAAMWEAIEQSGFRGGTVGEPGMGIGHFFGLMPEAIAKGSRLFGVELDSLTGRMARQLYQNADIRVEGFQNVRMPDNHYDLFISNVPFANVRITDDIDRDLGKLGASLHDYFFAKAVKKTRPGGLVMFITSRYSLDKIDSKQRKAWADMGANFLGAARLPATAFKASAATDVVTDIVVLQKRQPGAADTGEAFVNAVDYATGGKTYRINQYFAKHPEHILGTLAMSGTMYAGEQLNVEPKAGSLKQQAAKALGEIMARADKSALDGVAARTEAMNEPDVIAPAPEHLRQGALHIQDGKLWHKEGDRLIQQPLPEKGGDAKLARVGAMIRVRDAARNLLALQIHPEATDREVESARKALNKAYDEAVKPYGAMSKPYNRSLFSGDPDAALLLGLEEYDPDDEIAKKAEIFAKRTQFPHKPITAVNNADDALVASLNMYARVDVDYMGSLSGMTLAELKARLPGRIYQTPRLDWQTADEYLSGNVRAKLAEAREAAKQDSAFEENVKALEAVQPQDKPPGRINVRVGSSWIPVEDYAAFLQHLVGKSGGIRYIASEGVYVLEDATRSSWALNDRERVDWGTGDMPALTIMERLMNHKEVVVRRTDSDGKSFVDKNATAMARAKAENIKTEFKQWLWSEAARADRLVRRYNDLFNHTVLPTYDGSHLTLPGASVGIADMLRPHQKAAIWRIAQKGNTLLAHVVGSGKTWVIAGAVMEKRRLGLAKKQVIVVPNHLVQQWPAEFIRMYPGAKILAATPDDFTPMNRKRLMNRIATGDWDAIIVPMTSFEKVPLSPTRVRRFFDAQIADLVAAITEANADKDQNRSYIKELEKAKARLENLLLKLSAGWKKDVGPFFDDLGIDGLYVDEAHEYKNLYFRTMMTRVAGVAQSYTQKSFDMLLKTEYLNEVTGGKGVVFATGTPITNSICEMFTMQRYLQPGALANAGLSAFDAWASQFGETVTDVEISPEGGGFRMNTRFSKFDNVGELLQMFTAVADRQTADMLDLPRPKIIGDKAQVIEAPKSDPLAEIVHDLVRRAAKIRGGGVDPRSDNMLNVTTDGRKAALDLRLYDPAMPDLPISKVNRCVEEVYDIWKATAKKRLTQVVWCDLGTPDTEGHNVYADIKQKLVAKGVPAREIEFAQHNKTDIKRKKLFHNMNQGKVRIILASTQVMGTGANIQRKLYAAHHLDAPWRPADVEQRDGRILRQGNENMDGVRIVRYVTKGSFDAYMWQTLETKAKAIEQIMSGDYSLDTIEDISRTSLDFAEIKALASENPKIMEYVKLNSEVQQLSAEQAGHANEDWSLRREIQTRRENIVQHERKIPALKALIEEIEKRKAAWPEDAIPVVVQGKTYEKRTDAGKALRDIFEGMPEHTTIKAGEVYGYPITLAKKVVSAEFRIGLGDAPFTTKADMGEDAAGNITRILNIVGSVPNDLSYHEARIPDEQARIKSLEERAGKPWPKAELLTTKQAALERLRVEIERDNRPAPLSVVPEAMQDAPPSVVRIMATGEFRPQPDGRVRYEGLDALDDERLIRAGFAEEGADAAIYLTDKGRAAYATVGDLYAGENLTDLADAMRKNELATHFTPEEVGESPSAPAQVAMTFTAPKSTKRRGYEGVLFDKRGITATDGRTLIHIPGDAKVEKPTIYDADGKEIEGARFPDYEAALEGVATRAANKRADLDVMEEYDRVMNYTKAAFEGKTKQTYGRILDGMMAKVFSIDYYMDLLDAARRLGVAKLTVYSDSEADSGILFRETDAKEPVQFLVMPVDLADVETMPDFLDIGPSRQGRAKYRDVIASAGKADQMRARALWRKMFGDDKVEFVEKILDEMGQERAGRYEAGWTRIAAGKADPADTAMHEAVHRAEDLFLTPSERAALERAEPDAEKRAEGIIRYAQSRKGFIGKVRLIVEKLMRTLRRLFGAERGIDRIRAFYGQLLSGSYAERGQVGAAEAAPAFRPISKKGAMGEDAPATFGELARRFEKRLAELDKRPSIQKILRMEREAQAAVRKDREIRAKEHEREALRTEFLEEGGKEPVPLTRRGVIRAAKRIGAAEAKGSTVESLHESLKKIAGEEIPLPKTTQGVLREAFKQGMKEQRKKGFIRAAQDAIDIGFRDIAERYKGDFKKWQGALLRVEGGLAALEERLKTTTDEDTREAMSKGGLRQMFGFKRYLAIRQASRGDVYKTLDYLRERLDDHLTRFYAKAAGQLIARVRPQLLYNNPGTGMTLRQEWEALVEQVEGANEKAKAFRSAHGYLKHMRKGAASPVELEEQKAKALELGNEVREMLAKQPWKTTKGLFEKLSEIRAQSDLMQDVIAKGRRMVRGNMAEKIAAEVEDAVAKLDDIQDPKRRNALKNALIDARGDAMTWALTLGGGDPQSVAYQVLYERLRVGSRDAMTAVAESHKAFQEALGRHGFTDKDMMRMGTKETAHAIGKYVHKLTDAQAMDLYALTLDEEAATKLALNGFKSSQRRGMNEAEDIIQGEDIEGTAAIIDRLVSTLSEEQKALVRDIVRISNALAEEGNKTALRLFGYEKFLNPVHWRIRADRTDTQTFTAKDLDSVTGRSPTTLTSLGMLKERVPHGHTLMLENVFEAFGEQTTQMADFTHMSLPTLDALTALNSPDVRGAILKRLGARFAGRQKSMIARLTHLETHARSWGGVRRVAGAIERRAATAILGFRVTSILNNRIGGSILLAGEMFKLNPKLGADFARRVLPVSFLFSKANRDIRDALLSNGYFYNRWVLDPIRVFANLPTGERTAQTARQLRKRQRQNLGMHMMATAEMRNAVNAYKTLIRAEYSPAEALDMVEQMTRRTQNPSTALEETGLYTQLKESGLGIMVPFFGQPTVAANILLRDLQVWRRAMKSGEGKARATANLTVGAGALFSNAIFTTGLRTAVALAAGGAVYGMMRDDEKERQAEWSVIGLLGELMDVLLPGSGRGADFTVRLARKLAQAESPEAAVSATFDAIGKSDRDLVQNLLTRSLYKAGRGGKDIVVGLTEDEQWRVERGVLDIVEGLGMLAGEPVGGGIQAAKIASGAAGVPLGKERETSPEGALWP